MKYTLEALVLYATATAQPVLGRRHRNPPPPPPTTPAPVNPPPTTNPPPQPAPTPTASPPGSPSSNAGDVCPTSAGSCTNPYTWKAALPIPSTIDGTSGGSATITSSKICHQIFHNEFGGPCGAATEVWAYNGEFPGPTILAKKGEPFDITHENELGNDWDDHPIDITVHHHGLHIAPAFDGHPQPDYVTDSSFAVDPDGLIHPGNSFTYETTNDQEPGTHWYQ